MKPQIQLYIDRYRPYLFIGSIGAGLLLLFVFVLVPTFANISTLRDTLEEVKQTESELQKKRSLLESLDAQEMVTNLAIAQTALPGEKDIPAILNTIQNLSSQSQFSINEISFVPGTLASSASATQTTADSAIERHGARSLAVNLSGRGTREQFDNFLNAFQTSRRLMDMDSLSVQFTEGADSVSSSFTLYVYFLPPITQITKLESPIAQITDSELNTLQTITGFTDLTVNTFSGETAILPSLPLGKSDLFSL